MSLMRSSCEDEGVRAYMHGIDAMFYDQFCFVRLNTAYGRMKDGLRPFKLTGTVTAPVQVRP